MHLMIKALLVLAIVYEKFQCLPAIAQIDVPTNPTVLSNIICVLIIVIQYNLPEMMNNFLLTICNEQPPAPHMHHKILLNSNTNWFRINILLNNPPMNF